MALKKDSLNFWCRNISRPNQTSFVSRPILIFSREPKHFVCKFREPDELQGQAKVQGILQHQTKWRRELAERNQSLMTQLFPQMSSQYELWCHFQGPESKWSMELRGVNEWAIYHMPSSTKTYSHFYGKRRANYHEQQETCSLKNKQEYPDIFPKKLV